MKKIFRKFMNLPFNWFSSLVMPEDEDGIRNLYRIFLFAMLVLMTAFAVDVYVSGFTDKTFHGTFGDFFGGVTNPILTFFAFVGLLITITIQRVELKESRAELAKSASALEEQSKLAKQQSSIAPFYKLVDNHMAALAAIDLVSDDKVVTHGRDCIKVFRRRLMREFQSCTKPPDHYTLQSHRHVDMRLAREDKKAAYIAFREFWSADGEELQSYMAGVALTFSYIDTVLGGDEFYVEMYRSLFSDFERVLIFYFAISNENEQLRTLLRKYKFFLGIPPGKLLDQSHALGLEFVGL